MRSTLPRTLLSLALGATALCAQTEPGLPLPPLRPARAEQDAEQDAQQDAEDEAPMRRALAYSGRDLISQLLDRPGSLGSSTAAELARDVRISVDDARLIVEAAQRGAPVDSLPKLLELGLPAGKASSGLNLDKATAAQLEAKLGLTAAEAARFEAYRVSARRVDLYVREVRAVREARELGAKTTRDALAKLVTGTPRERARLVADALNLSAEPLVSREQQVKKAQEAQSLRVGQQAGQLLAPYRDSTGKVDWARLGKSEVAQGASGVGHFAFSLFLKELAVAAYSRDPERLQAFFRYVTSADFFLDYSLFATGARAADAVYGRTLRRLAKKGLLQGMLRSQIVLAAGLAVPMLARGQFELDAYLVDVAALGVSAAGVSLATHSGRQVFQLVRKGKPALRAGRLTHVAGWVFTAGETAVVLLLGDTLAHRLNRYLDERRLRERIVQVEERLRGLVGVSASPAAVGQLAEAVTELGQAHDAARAQAVQPLLQTAHALTQELEAGAREVLAEHAEADERRTRLVEHPRLAARIAEQHGSVEAYVAQEEDERVEELEAQVHALSERFDATFQATLQQAYVGDAAADEAPAPGSRLASYERETRVLLDALDLLVDDQARALVLQRIGELRKQHALDRELLRLPGAVPTAPVEGAAVRRTGLSGSLAR